MLSVHLPNFLLLSTTCLAFNRKLCQAKRQEKREPSEETKQSLELHLDMTQMLESPDKEFKINMFNIIKTNGKVENQMDNVSREKDTLIKKQN